MSNPLRPAFPSSSVLRAETIKSLAQKSKLYIIFLTPRSGSTWLTDIAINTGVLGAPQEWFNELFVYTSEPMLGCKPPPMRGITDINHYVSDVVEEGRGVAGVELSIHQARNLCDCLDETINVADLISTFFIRRRDILSQAISLHRSTASGRFHSYQKSEKLIESYNKVDYDQKKILNWIHHLLDSEKEFEDLFNNLNISPVDIFYEDLLADPFAVIGVIASHLNVVIPDSSLSSSLSIMRDEKNRQWRDRIEKEIPPELTKAIEDRNEKLAGR